MNKKITPEEIEELVKNYFYYVKQSGEIKGKKSDICKNAYRKGVLSAIKIMNQQFDTPKE